MFINVMTREGDMDCMSDSFKSLLLDLVTLTLLSVWLVSEIYNIVVMCWLSNMSLTER